MAARAVERASDILFADMPRLGFGCGDLFGGETHAASAKLVEAALDAGIRYFDVARLYGNGSAEAVLGSVLSRRRSQVIIASKVGIMPWSMLRWTRIVSKAAHVARSIVPGAKALVSSPPPAAARDGAFRLRDLSRSVNQSLKMLRTDYLDILLLHECTLAQAGRGEILAFLERLRNDGKIRCFGIATHYDETLRILNEFPAIAPVAQFASDALNCNVARIPAGHVELVVTHSPIKYVLPALMDHVAANEAAGARWEQATGIAPADRSRAAGLLLAEAVAQNAGGIVLFSSSRPEHIREAVAAIDGNSPRLGALREELAHIRSNRPSPP